MQLSARTPTAAAMAALTMDLLSDGRFVMGLGVSGPQVVEGWYGEPFAQPLARTREYVKIVRDVMAREKPVTNDGPHYPLPYPGGTGLGKPLKPITHPLRADLPIILGAEGPKNIALAAEIADGWLPIFYAPKHEGMYREFLDEGFARPGARRTADDFEVLAGAPVIVTDDVEAAADLIRPGIALYIGGMGAKEVNFHARVYERMGYEAEVAKIQDLYLAGHKAEATAAVPDPADRRDLAHRPEGEAARRPRRLAGIVRDLHAASARHPDHARHGRTAELSLPQPRRTDGNRWIHRLHRQERARHGRLVGSRRVARRPAREPRRLRHGAGPQRAAGRAVRSIASFIKADLSDPASIDAAIEQAPERARRAGQQRRRRRHVPAARRHRRQLPGAAPAVGEAARPHARPAAPSSTPRRWPARAGRLTSTRSTS